MRICNWQSDSIKKIQIQTKNPSQPAWFPRLKRSKYYFFAIETENA